MEAYVSIDELLSLLLTKGADHVMLLLIDLIRRREVKAEDAQLLMMFILAAKMDKLGDKIDDVKKSVEQVGERVDEVKKSLEDTRRNVEEVRRAVEEVGKRVDEVKRGIDGLDRRLLSVLEVLKSVNENVADTYQELAKLRAIFMRKTSF
jgi:hypothetical protein